MQQKRECRSFIWEVIPEKITGHMEGARKEKRPAEGFAAKIEAERGGAGLLCHWEFGGPSAEKKFGCLLGPQPIG